MQRWTGIILAAFLCWSAPTHAETPDELYAKADKLYDAEDYEATKAILLPLAENGHARAMNRIGYMHKHGQSYSPNPRLGCDWYEKSAKANYAIGQANIALCYKNGKGREQSSNLFQKWMTKAAEQDDIDAMLNLVQHFAPTNKDTATKWGQRAVDQGSVVARVIMTAWELPYKGPPPLITDTYCVGILMTTFGMPRDTCER